ncbi:UbiA family prenyltransferase [Notoacmeibacter sp. MSK16QG-6]|uniref:UbiA family prenyltransferase n=1 Tax=Notoacmeibacter sp. MSK16QG-6 TaxID=2957982 RepID=UPI0020A1A45C|nr:UbiA family prenyltransferase [Notoacmeibacter sp. MSK16QG-6]MCP1199619.1 UbiA family prenyltransferase [Notoacmeibacter sp. MSK16QG-6]
MDARTDIKSIPLAIDLDGTLVSTDLLWEGLFRLLRSNPLILFLVPIWIASGGPARLKHEVARRADWDVPALPYRDDVVGLIRDERRKGRTIILATGTPKPVADEIAEHLGLFDAVIATEDQGNMTSRNKADKLVELYGEAGFDYVGNSRADLPVLAAARQGTVVQPDASARRWALRNDAQRLVDEPISWRDIRKMLRVHQWLKNVLVIVPLMLAHEYSNWTTVTQAIVAFFSFSLSASAIYIVNDCFDMALDRAHPTKKNRPFASGRLSIPFGLMSTAVLLIAAFALSLFLPVAFTGVLAVYLLATTAYSFALKRMLLIDVFTLASLYTLRIIGGAAATQVDVSFWLLGFSIFFFLSLALVKRFVELNDRGLQVGRKIEGRAYRGEDKAIIAMSGVSSGFGAAMVLALYIQSDSVAGQYSLPWLLWPLAPAILFICMRIWILAYRGEMHDDPIVFIMSDWRSQAVAAIGALLVVGALVL